MTPIPGTWTTRAGAPREGYFEGLPHLGRASDEERAAFFVQHDTYWV